MPKYELLGVEIYIPDLDEIVSNVTDPLQNAISSATGQLQQYISDALAPLQQYINALQSQFLAGLTQLQNQFFAGLESVTAGLNQLSTAIQSGIAQVAPNLLQVGNLVLGGMQQLGAQLTAGFTEVGNFILQGAESVAEGILRATQQGFDYIIAQIRQVDFLGQIQHIIQEVRRRILEVLMPTQPRSPEQAKAIAQELVLWGNVLFSAIAAAQIAAEAASAGQLDYSLGAVWEIPVLDVYRDAVRQISETALRASLLESLEYSILAATTPKIPPPSDLISFVVKECFPLEKLPEAPAEFTKYMRFQGYNELWSRAYWEAHWRLPSPERIYEAFHRGILSEDEVKKYIVWHDYKPTPRPGIHISDVDLMLKLTYRLPTRTEARMMYEMGILGDQEIDEIVRAEGIEPRYRDKFRRFIKEFALRDDLRRVEREARHLFVAGKIDEAKYREYLKKARIPEEWFDLFVELAKMERLRKQKEEKEKAREITLSRLLKAWELGIITEDELRKALAERGYQPDDIDIIIATELAEQAEKRREKYANELEDLVVKGQMSLSDYAQSLRDLGFSEDEIQYRVALARVKAVPRRRLLTPTQVAKAFWRGLMSPEEAFNYLQKLGYTPQDAEILIMLYKPKTEAEMASEVE